MVVDWLNRFVICFPTTTFYHHQVMLIEQLQPILVVMGNEDSIERRANVFDL